MKIWFKSLFIILIIVPISLYGQVGEGGEVDLFSKMATYKKSTSKDLIFLHTDKNIYTNNETIWFSAYLINDGLSLRFRHDILVVGIVREDNQQLYLQEKFVLQNDLVFGSVVLPDSIPPGNYQIIVYTNLLDNKFLPLTSFSQSIVVKNINQTDFDVRVALVDSVISSDGIRVRLFLKSVNSEMTAKNKPVVEYSVDGGARKLISLDRTNSCIISVPPDVLKNKSPILLASVAFKSKTKYVSILLPSNEEDSLTVKFYPEGGFLVDGIRNIVGFETLRGGHRSTPITAVLFKDQEIVDTISSNSYGLGRFAVVPDSGKKYSVRVLKNNKIDTNTVFYLPSALANGIVLHIEKAVIDDTLRFQIQSVKDRMDLTVVIHNFKEVFAQFSIVAESKAKIQTVVLSNIPKGLTTISILDRAHRPLAERLVFAKYNQGNIVEFLDLKQSYGKRERVSIRLKVSNKENGYDQGVVSIACAQENRFGSGIKQDIESYLLLNSKLSDLPPSPIGRHIENLDYLENILLVRGWSKYSWQKLMAASSSDTLVKSFYPEIKGKVNYFNRSLRKPVTVNLMKNLMEFNLIETDARGVFPISTDNLVIPQGKKVRATVNVKDKEGYQIELIDPYVNISQVLARKLDMKKHRLAMSEKSSKEFQLTGMQHVTQLDEFIVRADGIDNTIYGVKRGPNDCGDYVIGQILYYPPSKGINSRYYNLSDAKTKGRQPEKGVSYMDGMKGRYESGQIEYIGSRPGQKFTVLHMIYEGCIVDKDKSIFDLEGIYKTREFNCFDGSPENIEIPQLISTLFWKSGIVINNKGEAECSFYTGDIVGKFSIVVQGVGSTNLIYGEQMFEVK
jgi:hypothetical protein